MSMIERAEKTILSKIDRSIAFFQEEFEDIDLPLLDLFKAENTLRARVTARFADEEECSDEDTILRLGEGDLSTPATLARLAVIDELKNMLGEIEDLLEKQQETDEKKISSWVGRVSGGKGLLKMGKLTIVKKKNSQLEEVIGGIKAIVDSDAKTLQDFIEKNPEPDEGVERFYHDLVKTKLGTPGVAELMAKLITINDPETIDEILDDEALKQIEGYNALHFMGSVLKDWLAVNGRLHEDEMEEEEKEEDTVH